jgi:16S rRNA (uracil1498-N3)-methyltransferase
MTVPYFLVDALPGGPSYTVDGPEGHHAAVVQRLRIGERLVLTDGRGGTATAVVTAVGRGSLDVTLISQEYAQPLAPRLVVVQGIAKGDRGELAVQAMTEAGVDEIVPWAASRSVVQWRGERGERAYARWVAVSREAAKQSRRAWLPSVAPAAATDAVGVRLAGAALGLVLYEDAATRLSTVDLPACGEVALVVGPEGGIALDELARFEAAGAIPVRLGETVLRTSTAGVAALAVLSARLGRW